MTFLYSRIDANKQTIFFCGGSALLLSARNNTHTIYILYISTFLGLGGGGGATTGINRGGGWVAPAAKHERKRSEKPAHVFGFPCSRSASLGPRLLC